ncbi:uncharacterized protein E0L32_002187 [Thyridium curvatum]|uniref:DUF7357 domain-containing protein n=1 Tax=Thyridium curvatum TaxID=1093900 RepID=A0A507APE2_9PEZI|nr:uncharacterized protein E0L32_002187 [Thyridium curvatum]TPX06691.1 hypothetical protein E0L32_002187 [Thyridium curvatum]
MSDSSLRLRLAVRRHGLPEVKIVFILPLEGDPTVSKLLELVNDTVPLESADWGLEDYAVELPGGFECLHFQPVRTVIEKDEEVVIRPLLTDDIKRRRVSGRLQITSDGKHLIDGVPFGRPLLKRARRRPPVRIEPRKRARLTYGDDEEEDDQDEGEEPLLLTQYGEFADSDDPSVVRFTSTFDDADALDPEEGDGDFDGEADDDDSEYGSSDEEDHEDLASGIEEDELQALQDDLAGDGDAMDTEDSREKASKTSESHLKAYVDLSTLDKITALKEAFPSCATSQCERMLQKHRNNEVKAYRDLARSHDAEIDLEDMLLYMKSLREESQVRFDDQDDVDEDNEDNEAEDHDEDYREGRADDDRDVDEEDDEEDDEDDADSLVRHFDRHGLPPGSIANGTALDFMAAVRNGPAGQPLVSRVKRLDLDDDPANESTVHKASGQPATTESDKRSDSTSDSSSDSGSDSSDDNSEEAHSSGGESSDSDADSDEDFGTSSSGSSSSGDERSDSADNKSLSGSSDSSSDSSSDDSSDDSSSDSAPEETSSKKAPTQPSPEKSNTESRSTSHTQSASVAQDQGLEDNSNKHTEMAPGQGTLRTKLRNARRRAAQRVKKLGLDGVPQGNAPVNVSKDVDDADFQARKAALLASLGEAGKEPIQAEQVADAPKADEPPAPSADAPSNTPKVAEEGMSIDKADDADTPRRRMRLDVGAGRRMLFGALGLRNPKSKADEDKLRSDLMKDVRPHASTKSQEPAAAAEVVEDNDDPEAWRSKINYSAVECCQEGIELSEPPFPFVQRWDPQQQYSWQGKRGKGKRQQRNQSHFYEDDDSRGPKKQKTSGYADYEASSEFAGFDDSIQLDADVTLNYDDEEPTKEDQHNTAGDLPCLPADVSSLPGLEQGAAKPDMIITWKQLLLSKATNWEPKVVDLTALILQIQDDGAQLHVRLAMRDREQKTYNEETGERVYDRHEALDADDEDQEDDGLRELPFAELVEPRILRQAPADTTAEKVVPHSEVIEETQQCNDTDVNGLQSLHSDAVNFSHAIEVWEQDKNKVSATSAPSAEGFIPETYHDEVSKSNSTQPAQQTSDAFLSQDHDHLNPDTGDSPNLSGARDEDPDLDSPSQQLEETSQAWVSERASHEPLLDETANTDETTNVLSGKDTENDKRNNGLPNGSLDTPVASADSLNSGRQPDPDLPLDAEPESLQSAGPMLSISGSKTPLPGQQEDGSRTPTLDAKNAQSGLRSGVSSPGSLPSLSEVWLSASQSRSTQDSARNDEDKGHKDVSPAEIKKSATPPPMLPQTRGQKVAASSQVNEIPAGSQVISLLSSSPEPEPEPEFTEDYADDSVDETYSVTKPSAVKAAKQGPKRQRMKRVSLTPSSQGGRAGSKRPISSSQGQMSALSVLSARRKMSARF